MGQPSDPGSDPAERRWTIYRCLACGVEGLGKKGIESARHGAGCPAKLNPSQAVKLAKQTDAVPAGGLVAELEAERARADKAEKECGRLREATANMLEQAMKRSPAERSAVPTATVSEELCDRYMSLGESLELGREIAHTVVAALAEHPRPGDGE
jgi:hypothetical protein